MNVTRAVTCVRAGQGPHEDAKGPLAWLPDALAVEAEDDALDQPAVHRGAEAGGAGRVRRAPNAGRAVAGRRARGLRRLPGLPVARRLAAGVPVAPVVPGVPVVPGAGAGGAGVPPSWASRPVAQRELSSTLLIRLTWPLRASSRPMTVAPLLSEMLASAIRLPWKAVVVPSVAELPTCQ